MDSAVIFHSCAQGVYHSSRLICLLMTSSATSRLRLDFHHINVVQPLVTHPSYNDKKSVFFFIPILKSTFSNLDFRISVLRFLSEWRSSVQTTPTIVQVQVQVELYCHSPTCVDIQWNEMSCLTGPLWLDQIVDWQGHPTLDPHWVISPPLCRLQCRGKQDVSDSAYIACDIAVSFTPRI